MEKSDLTFGEGLAAAILTVPFVLVLWVVLLLVGLGLAWFDVRVWNWWVAPMLGLHPASLLAAFFLGQLLSLNTSRQCKSESDTSPWISIFVGIGSHITVFIIAWLCLRYR